MRAGKLNICRKNRLAVGAALGGDAERLADTGIDTVTGGDEAGLQGASVFHGEERMGRACGETGKARVAPPGEVWLIRGNRVERCLKGAGRHHLAEGFALRIVWKVHCIKQDRGRAEPVTAAIGCFQSQQGFGLPGEGLMHTRHAKQAPAAAHDSKIPCVLRRRSSGVARIHQQCGESGACSENGQRCSDRAGTDNGQFNLRGGGGRLFTHAP